MKKLTSFDLAFEIVFPGFQMKKKKKEEEVAEVVPSPYCLLARVVVEWRSCAGDAAAAAVFGGSWSWSWCGSDCRRGWKRRRRRYPLKIGVMRWWQRMRKGRR